MSGQFRVMSWSIALGEWSGTRIRFSVWFVLAGAVLCLQLSSVSLGLMATAALCFSVLLHEMSHVWVARGTGGWCDEILAWPLGGLLFPSPHDTRRAQVLTALAGPAVHSLVCLVTGITVWRAGLIEGALNPLSGWPALSVSTGIDVVRSVIVMLFVINWALFLINLLPVHPFDGGRVLECLLSEWLVEETATDLYLRLGALSGVGCLMSGMLADQPGWHGTWVVALGAVVLVLNLDEISSRRASDELDSLLLEYELALDDVVEEFEPVEDEEGLLERWRQEREASGEEQEQDQQRAFEREVDMLLKKIHDCGYEGLSEDEQRQLLRASRQYRDRTGRSEETV